MRDLFAWLVVVALIGVPLYAATQQLGPWDTAVYWDDLRFDVNTVKKGATQPPDDNTTLGTLLFSGTRTEDVFLVAQMPHGYKYGTNLHPHVHYMKSSSAAGGVVWKIDYECRDIGETFTGSSLPESVTMAVAVSDSDTAFKHALHEGAFDPVFTGPSGTCIINLYRDHDAAGDTYEADVNLIEFDIHFQSDSIGSKTEYGK